MAVLCFSYGSPSFSQSPPANADATRIAPLQYPEELKTPAAPMTPSATKQRAPIPEAIQNTRFTLKKIELRGVTAFSQDSLLKEAATFYGQEISLGKIWKIAEDITQYYQNHGFFISRAYIPAQEIDDGVVIISVTEGQIAEASIDNASGDKQPHIIRQAIAKLLQTSPISSAALESFMLQINALSGVTYRAVLEPMKNGDTQNIKLSLKSYQQKPEVFASFDNYGSRFLGPYQAAAYYQGSLIPYQETIISGLTSIPGDELQFLSLAHAVPLHPDWTARFHGSYVTAAPGASLEQNDLTSSSIDFGIGAEYQMIRERQQNLMLNLTFSGRNTNSDILGNTPLTRDRLRILSASVNYDLYDRWDGYTRFNTTLNQGLRVLGASQKNDPNLSRTQASGEFTNITLDLSRQQLFTENWLAIGQVSAQLASGPLLSSEEFGFGGQRFGRAYDPSEITGDNGAAGSLELRYLGVSADYLLQPSPYLFYDIGKVWNHDTGISHESAASGGIGILLQYDTSTMANLAIAWPLTQKVNTPLYGGDTDPRFLLQTRYRF